jgi:hypothetical protein
MEDPLLIFSCLDFLALQSKEFEWIHKVERYVRSFNSWHVGWKFSSALASKRTSSHEIANIQLQDAIISAPYVVPFLMEAIANSDFDRKQWESLYVVENVQDHLLALSKIWAMRCGPVWKYPENAAWLQSIVQRFLSKELSVDPVYRFVQLNSMQDYLPIYRHAVISGKI